MRTVPSATSGVQERLRRPTDRIALVHHRRMAVKLSTQMRGCKLSVGGAREQIFDRPREAHLFEPRKGAASGQNRANERKAGNPAACRSFCAGQADVRSA